MRPILLLVIGLSALTFGAASAHSKKAARFGCPDEYARLGPICISRSSGDIVLPASKKADAREQIRAVR